MPPPNTKKVFGQATRTAPSAYQRQMGSSNKYTGAPSTDTDASEKDTEWENRKAAYRLEKFKAGEALDLKMGYERHEVKGQSRIGWLFNMLPTSIKNENGVEKSGLDLYFLEDGGGTFKSTVFYQPYFYVAIKNHLLVNDVTQYLNKRFDGSSMSVSRNDKEDLELPNHLSGKLRMYLKLEFLNVNDMMEVRQQLLPIVKKKMDGGNESSANSNGEVSLVGLPSTSSNNTHRKHDSTSGLNASSNLLDEIVDIREYDVTYLMRVCIDLEIRAGLYYTVTPQPDRNITLTLQTNDRKPTPGILAFDIECTKAPLKFPDAEVDEIFMISYMINGMGYLIISREIVSSDIQDFEYTPKPAFPGPFKIFNEKNESDLIRRFFTHVQELKPQIFVTFNGDYFDWPFLEMRASKIGVSMFEAIGIEKVAEEYRGRCAVHLDAFAWVKRDSYLPQGSQGLKAVTRYKLGYDPVEVDPEDMVRYASEKPLHMASYSVSDAVATYYLYDQYVHLFIFSLCTLIPLGPEDVLRKGSGTLCEALLMVEAYRNNIICPNKHISPLTSFHNGHLLESETYIGGHVECLETGVYRADIPCKFNLVPKALQGLIDHVDRDLTFYIEVEGGMQRSDVVNYDEIKSQIVEKLELLRDAPVREEEPYIYHLDVGAMYPNIILTNRLQPGAIVSESTCASCDFNTADNDCKRKMDWVWRGDYNPAKKSEYESAKFKLQYETVEGRPFHELDQQEQADVVSKRLKLYSQKVYKKSKETREEQRSDTVCMRENPFYVETVRNFRDRRYDYKLMTKTWKKKIALAEAGGDAVAARHAGDMALVYDSLQVAHKCILNSFYGYVMRKGARWRSMEMAGIVTLTGAQLIKQARELVEQIGRPLELDTDGIWCILPKSFPSNFNFETADGGKLEIEYPCCMLNSDVACNYTNHQYQTLTNVDTRTYTTRSECSIFFEVDGPYKAMILPSSTEEGKLLKKRYAVFNFDGSLAELKGFELKRRGELEIIKAFQLEVFEHFLDGDSLESCYDAVAKIANHWLDVLDSNGDSLGDAELFDLISENRNMSRQLEDYGAQKGTSMTTAKRLGEFLGKEIIKDKGLNCKFIISTQPYGAPVTERAIPTAIWKAEPAVMKAYLRKWLKEPNLVDFDIRSILDWEYYRQRLTKTIQKIITIPAALQGVLNPVPRIVHPEWLSRLVRRQNDKRKQTGIRELFSKSVKGGVKVVDMEDTFGVSKVGGGRVVVRNFGRSGGSGKGKVRLDGESSALTVLDGNADADANADESNNNDTATAISLLSKSQPRPKLLLTKDTTQATFKAWLSHRKSQWSTSRKESKRERNYSLLNDFKLDPSKRRKVAGNVSGLLRDAAQGLTHGHWQVLEVRETDTPGEFVVFVMIRDDAIQKIQLLVPRTVYVNCRSDDGRLNLLAKERKGGCRKITGAYLPHARTPMHLYQVTTSERKFQSSGGDGSGGSSVFQGPQVEAVYESQTPLHFEAVTRLGSITRVLKHRREEVGKSKVVSLDDLETVERPSFQYLDQSAAKFKRIFLYHSCPGKAKGVVALFFMSSHASNLRSPSPDSLDLSCSCLIWIVKPAANKQHQVTKKACDLLFPRILGLFKSIPEGMEDMRDEYTSLSRASECSFALDFVSTEQAALKRANDALAAYLQEKRGPTIIVTNSTDDSANGNQTSGANIKKILTATASYPVVNVGCSPPSSLPPLNWEQSAVQFAMESYVEMAAVAYPHRLREARYANVPIASFKGDDVNCVMFDVFYSRQLRKARLLLWASESAKPDLGDDLDGGGSDLWTEEEEGPVVCNPGAYRTICVEVKISHLAVSAIRELEVSQANANAGAGAGGSDNGMGGVGVRVGKDIDKDKPPRTAVTGSSSLGDSMAVARSFPILASLISTWFKEASTGNETANELLRHCYRIVSSSDSLLHDPAMLRVLNGMMHRMFSMLVAEFEHLGATVVFANYSKIIIATNKVELPQAKEYAEFVVKTIRSRERFNEVMLDVVKFRSDLLFLDAFNFGGVEFVNTGSVANADADCGRTGGDMDDGNDDDKEDDDDDNKVTIVNGERYVSVVESNWHMAEYLASDTQREYFRGMVGRFSRAPYEKRRELIKGKRNYKHQQAALTPNSPGVSSSALSQGGKLVGYADVNVEDELVHFKRNVMCGQIASKVTRMIDEITSTVFPSATASFPNIPGKHLNPTIPALEFIKSMTKVFDLDVEVRHEVTMLRKSVLTQIGMHEYSEDSIWSDPCHNYILPNVFCAACHECADVNLCISDNAHTELDNDGKAHLCWDCPDCDAPYDMTLLENRIIGAITKRCAQYQVQDYRCSKTMQINKRAMARQSESSKGFVGDVDFGRLREDLGTLRQVAEFHRLEFLKEIVGSLIFD